MSSTDGSHFGSRARCPFCGEELTEEPDGPRYHPPCAETVPADRLLDLTLRSMHALNRRAKHPGVDSVEWSERMERIYSLKDRFLEALVAAGRAAVARFRIERPGEPPQVWYLVTSGGYSFHVPGEDAGPAVRAAAVEAPPHDPYQGAREIPDTGLDEDQEIAVVAFTTERLGARGVRP